LHDHRLTPLFLPTYASWLNPIEKLWRWLKQDVLHLHRLAHDLMKLRQRVLDFLDQFTSGSQPLLHYVGLL
jgi:transposase